MPLGHVTRGALAHLAFLQRENDFRHHTYEQETPVRMDIEVRR